jgi:probable HAF family extracellular repeat protein
MPVVRPRHGAAVLFVTLAGSCVIASAAQPSLHGLGFLPGNAISSATALSADGRTVVGYAANDGEFIDNSFRWTADTGMVRLVYPPDVKFAVPHGTSGDGSVVVGRGTDGVAVVAFRWTESGTRTLPMLNPADRYGEAFDISADGSVIVGISRDADYFDVAVRWDAAGVHALGTLAPPTADARTAIASDVTPNGSVIVGYSPSHNGRYEAFRWTAAGGMVGLGDLPGGEFLSRASGVSDDGSTVVGASAWATLSSAAFRWTADSGMVRLVGMDGASDTSGDGSVVVGSRTDVSGDTAMIWTAADGTRRLDDALRRAGVDTGGWRLRTAFAVSADGLTIAGDGINPAGQNEAYIAVLPEPAAPTAALLRAAAALNRTRNRGRRRVTVYRPGCSGR